MSTQLTLQITNQAEAIGPTTEATTCWLEQHGATPSMVYLASLTIEELVTNCIKYAYDDAGEHPIGIELEMADGAMRLSVSDDGRPFNPLTLPPPDLSLPAEERPVGGLGIYILRKHSDRMDYRRSGATNHVTVWKHPAPPSLTPTPIS
jgi:hypothetical protein